MKSNLKIGINLMSIVLTIAWTLGSNFLSARWTVSHRVLASDNGTCYHEDGTSYPCPHRGDIELNNPLIPYVISPRRTYLLNPHPYLSWNAVEGANSYTVILEKNGGEESWQFEFETNEGYLDREQWAALEPGADYQLSVIANTGEIYPDWRETPIPDDDLGIGFRVLNEGDREMVLSAQEAIEQQELTEEEKAFQIVELYQTYDLNLEAIAILEALLESDSENKKIYQLLGDLYWEDLRLYRIAGGYYERTLELATPEDNLEEIQQRLEELNEALNSTP